MAYTHLTPNELVMIEAYFNMNHLVTLVSKNLNCSRQTIYNVYNALKQGETINDYYQKYKENKTRCGRKAIVLPKEQHDYIQTMVIQGWTPDVIIGRAEFPISCSVRTLYRKFKDNQFDWAKLPMKGKRKPNGHKERRGKQAFKRHISERIADYPEFQQELEHLEGETIVGVHHKSAVITLVERLSKVIITLKPDGRKVRDIEKSITDWLQHIPRNVFKSITFDCGKEFSNWKGISNSNDVSIYFADPRKSAIAKTNPHDTADSPL